MTSAARKRIRSPKASALAKENASESSRKDPERIAMAGGFVRGITQISASNIALTVAFGTTESDGDVLVPIVHWQLYGRRGPHSGDPPEDQFGDELFSSIFPFENLAFLLQDMSFDIREAVRLLVAQSQGGIVPMEDRMRYAAKMLSLAQENLSAATEQIAAELLGGETSDDTQRDPF